MPYVSRQNWPEKGPFTVRDGPWGYLWRNPDAVSAPGSYLEPGMGRGSLSWRLTWESYYLSDEAARRDSMALGNVESVQA